MFNRQTKNTSLRDKVYRLRIKHPPKQRISARVSEAKLVLARKTTLFRAAAERSGLSSAYNPRQSTEGLTRLLRSVNLFLLIQPTLRNDARMSAFTLAEVLITLGIIGVVASLTIPTLMNNINEANYKVGYKKAFSVASQAWQQAIADDKISPRPTTTPWTDLTTRIDNFNAFKSNFKVVTDCNSGSNNSSCWASGDKFASSYPDDSAYAFIDASGVSWSIDSSTATTGAEIQVDTNGLKKPNQYGLDRFILYPVPGDGLTSTSGIPVKIKPLSDCLDTTTANCGGVNYAIICPSVEKHPCYFQTWLFN